MGSSSHGNSRSGYPYVLSADHPSPVSPSPRVAKRRSEPWVVKPLPDRVNIRHFRTVDNNG